MEFDAAATIVRHALQYLQLLDVQALQQTCCVLRVAVERAQPDTWGHVVRNTPLRAGHPLQAVMDASNIPRLATSLARLYRSLRRGRLSHVSQILLGDMHTPLGPEAINPQGTLMLSRRADCLCLLDLTHIPPASEPREVTCLPLPVDQRGRWEAVKWAPDGSSVCVFLRTVEGPLMPWAKWPYRWRGVLCLIPVADPRLVVIHDPDYPWSEAPLTFTRNSRYLLMPALYGGSRHMEGEHFITFDCMGQKVAMMEEVQVYAGPRGASLAHLVCNYVAVAGFACLEIYDVTVGDKLHHHSIHLSSFAGCNNSSCCMHLVAANPAGTLLACMLKEDTSLYILDAVNFQRRFILPLADLDHTIRGTINSLAWVLHGWLLSTTITSFPPSFESIHIYARRRSRRDLTCMQTLKYHWPNGTMPVVSPDGRYFARLTQDTRAVEIYDIPTGRLMLTQTVEVSEGLQVLNNPANSALLWGGDGSSLLVRQPAVQLALSDDTFGHAGSTAEQLLILRF